MEKEERKKEREKEQEAPFKSTVFGANNFYTDKATFGGDFNMPSKKLLTSRAGLVHDRAFFPSSPAKVGGTIGAYPEYKPNPSDFPSKKEAVEREPWRTTSRPKTVHTPSIAANIKNLRQEYFSPRNYR